MDSKLARWCNGLIEAGWLAAIVATPLFFDIHSDRVFEPDKLTLLRSIALLMVTAWLVKFIDQRGWQDLAWLRWRDGRTIWRMPFVLPVFLLAVVYLLSNLFSVTPIVSWAGSYQRLQGTYTTLSYIVVFALVAATMRTPAQVQRAITAVIMTSIPISFYALLQHFDLDPLPWGGDTQRRVAGHMGNAIFVAAYLIMVVPPTLSRIIDAFTNILGDEELSVADVIRSSIYIFTLAIQLLAIYWSGSRGPWLGLGVALFAFVLIVLVTLRNAATQSGRFRLVEAGQALLMVAGGTAVLYALFDVLLRGVIASGRFASLTVDFASFLAFVAAVGFTTLAFFVMISLRRGWRWLWLSWLFLSLLLAGWLLAFNFADELAARSTPESIPGRLATTLEAWQDLPGIGRLGRLLEAESGTGRVRVLIWEGVLQLIGFHEPLQFPDGKQDQFNFLRPFIGYGPESMYVAYNRFYPPELATIEARNASPDRSHNETFDALVITGGLGFLFWQALYLSVFYYGFKWLGVVRSTRDRNMLVGLWIGGALLSTLLLTRLLGIPYLGIAIPFGSIIGLALYLIYYALFTQIGEDAGGQDPFQADRLLLIALVTAVLAHYAEIHFGIAIAATRLHFFAYVGLMFISGYLLPRRKEASVAAPAATPVEPARSKRRRAPVPTREPAIRSAWGPVLIHGLLILLMVSILGFEFMTYSLPPDKQITSAADISVGEIFHQSLFLNAKQDFQDSPFIFLMMILTWTLGSLLSISEMMKSGDLSLSDSTTAWRSDRQQLVGALLGLGGLASLALVVYRYFVAPPETISGTLGRTLATLAMVLCLTAAALIFTHSPRARLVAGVVALVGLLFALPLLVSGAVVAGLVTAVLTAILLYLVWDQGWNQSLRPVAIMAFISVAGGLFYSFLQANLVKYSIAPQTSQTFATTQDLRVFEAGLATNFLNLFYVFIILLLLLGAFVLARHYGARAREFGQTSALVALPIVFLLAFVGIAQTNVRIVQADIVFKRGKPFDQEAMRQGRSADNQAAAITAWDNTIAIYEEAINLAPREDFYYLFLGRAYLERSTIETDAVARQTLFQKAETRLERAQQINPLNTDHTANLARLNTRLTQLAGDAADRQERLDLAETYYQDALSLSPQNSVIRNEYAALTVDLKQDCPAALLLYDESVKIDPYYELTYFARADAYISCVTQQGEAVKTEYYTQAAASLEEGLVLLPTNTRAWLQLGQLYQELQQYQAAVAAFDNALLHDTSSQLPAWNVNYLIATAYQADGNTDMAVEKAQLALVQAPAEAAPQIQQLLTQLGVTPTESAVPPQSDSTVLTGERPLASLEPTTRNNYYTTPPAMRIDPTKTYDAVIVTTNGEMRFRLYAAKAPQTVNNFIFLAQQGFYDNTTFHRVLADFMAQGGDPTGSGMGGPGYTFADEVSNGLTFDKRGLLAMANAGPNTNGSQFFITFVPTPHLNGNHTIFGELIAGDDVLSRITLRDPATSEVPGDLILRIDIAEVNQ